MFGKKKIGSWRLPCDSKYINSVIVNCRYPMSSVDDVLNVYFQMSHNVN